LLPPNYIQIHLQEAIAERAELTYSKFTYQKLSSSALFACNLIYKKAKAQKHKWSINGLQEVQAQAAEMYTYVYLWEEKDQAAGFEIGSSCLTRSKTQAAEMP
jgi:hypothetical protein